jgi:N-carbamoyl-L-amino-acid hydrolase
VTATGIRGEENYWFSAQHIGSRAALGRLPPKTLDTPVRVDTGLTLAHHMADAVRRGTACLRPESLAGFIELHIEQEPVLEAANISTGIVSAIRGNGRCHDVRCISAYDHAGAVPRRLRVMP